MLPGETVDAIREFNDRNDVTLQQQWFQLLEELGEAAEAYNRDDEAAFREELTDIHFVVVSLALLEDPNHGGAMHETAMYNLRKSGRTDGNKVVDDA